MNTIRDMQCDVCETVFEHMQPFDAPKRLRDRCPSCERTRSLERVYVTAPAVTFGMISGAVRGSGFYNTDYGRAKSDLVDGRALEHAARRGIKTQPRVRGEAARAKRTKRGRP